MSGSDQPGNHVSPFPYPGSKGRESDWIISRMPPHDCYVEVFGGSGAILFNKPPSHNEVYNDLNDDLVQFFETLRNCEGELIEWLRQVPYSRTVYNEWVEDYFAGVRPDDPIERAGRFFALRHMQVAGRIDSRAGFQVRNKWTPARSFDNARERLDELAGRFRQVIIENRDWRRIFDGYDADWSDPGEQDVLFYCDPPYVGDEGYYATEFDHAEFVNALQGLGGRWMVSYATLPDGLEDYTVLGRQKQHRMCHGSSESTEHLICNFNPDNVASFVDANQQQEALASFTNVADVGGEADE